MESFGGDVRFDSAAYAFIAVQKDVIQYEGDGFDANLIWRHVALSCFIDCLYERLCSGHNV